MGEVRERMEMAMRMKNFSTRTIESYVCQAKAFVRHHGKSPTEMGEAEVQEYLESLVKRHASVSLVRIAYSALKFLYVETLHREWRAEQFLLPRREKRLPEVLSGEEVKRIFDAVGNERNRMILMTCYSAGLRIGEAVHLRVSDIDSQRMQIRVEQGKGKKDRYTTLSKGLLGQLRGYWKIYRPQVWLFTRDITIAKPVSVDSVQRAFMRAKKKRGSPKPSAFILCGTVLQPTC